MKELVLFNSDDGFIVEEVDATQPKFCTSAFIYKRDNVYFLVDRNTGLAIARSNRKKYLEEIYNDRKEKYDSIRKTDAYNIKVERFEKMKVVNNYGKEHK